jgi:hypothetical protein
VRGKGNFNVKQTEPPTPMMSMTGS